MGFLARLFDTTKANDSHPPSAREVEAQKLKRVMHAAAAMQTAKPNEVFKRRHLSGLSFPGVSVIPARIPVSLTRGSLRNIDPWWHADPVQRHYGDDELTEDRRAGQTENFLIRTETRDVVLLDGRRIQTIRKIYFDKQSRRNSKELFMKDETGKVSDYNQLPRSLLPLDDLELVSIGPDKEIVLVEGYPAAESLRARGIDALGIIGGTFEVPSDRALDPVLKARTILLWPDNDSAGVFLMSGVAKALDKMGARTGQIKFVRWHQGPRKGDAYDFEGDADELQSLLDEAVVWSPDLRFPTNSIQRLSVPRAAAQLRLDDGVQPPTPELVRETPPTQTDAVIADTVAKYLSGEALSDREKGLMRSLFSQFAEDEG